MIALIDDFEDILIALADAEAVDGHALLELRGRAIPVIGLGALLKNKRASGRPQDLADVHALDPDRS